MEELLVYEILLCEKLTTENDYHKRFDELFLEDPANDDLLYLEWETNLKGYLRRYGNRPHDVTLCYPSRSANF